MADKTDTHGTLGKGQAKKLVEGASPAPDLVAARVPSEVTPSDVPVDWDGPLPKLRNTSRLRKWVQDGRAREQIQAL